jgi:hypothetical protein
MRIRRLRLVVMVKRLRVDVVDERASSVGKSKGCFEEGCEVDAVQETCSILLYLSSDCQQKIETRCQN